MQWSMDEDFVKYLSRESNKLLKINACNIHLLNVKVLFSYSGVKGNFVD